jgi:transposase
MKKNNTVQNHNKAKGDSGWQALEGLTIGIDLGDERSWYCVLDRDGEKVGGGSLSNTARALAKQFGGLKRTRIALETGAQTGWISRELEAQGHEVIVANARELRAISGSGRKSDRRDAEKLARYARVDPAILRPVRVRGAQAQLDLGRIRARDALVRARTLLVNAARGLAKTRGQRLVRSVTASFGKRSQKLLGGELAAVLAPLLEQIDALGEQIKRYDQQIKKQAAECYPETAVLDEAPSIGPLTALSFVLTLEDAGRFRHSRDVGPYLGLCSRRRQSGGRDPKMRISKEGDEYLRRLLVQCAHSLLGKFGADSALRRWGLRLAQSGGKHARQRAIVAVARKLAVLLHKLWVTQQSYRAFPDSQAVAAAAARDALSSPAGKV